MKSKPRLLWSCRRGMLELDVLLQNYVTQCYDSLKEEDGLILDKLLNYPDQTLFDLFMGKIQDDNMEVNALVKTIRSTPGLINIKS